MPSAVRSPPGTAADALAPLIVPLAEVKSEKMLEQPESEQTRNVSWPVLFVSGSLKPARSVGVRVASDAASAGETSDGTSGATETVLLVADCTLKLAASLPATSFTRPLPGCAYATVTASSLCTAAASVSVTVEPATETFVGSACAEPLTRTVNALPAGVDEPFSGSSKTTARDEPSTFAEANTGAVVSTTKEREDENAEAAVVLSVAFACQ